MKIKIKIFLILLFLLASSARVYAEVAKTCAVVRLQILQEVTFERLAFDAELKLTNNLDDIPLENIRVDVVLSDEDGVVANEVFFIKTSDMTDVTSVDGTGTIAPLNTGIVNWLIIPGNEAGGGTVTGKRYAAKAEIFYSVSGKQYNLTTWEDWITVKPEPRLQIDYFLPKEVVGDDPFTTEVEPAKPFKLGVRVKNTGYGKAIDFKIDSSQPKIIDNEKGLLVDYEILGSWIDGVSAPKSLQVNFGDLEGPYGSKIAYWDMIATMSGEFTEFGASFSHSNELGGEMTSLIERVDTHYLIKDLIIDLPGRDENIDFFADANMDGIADSVYESDGSSFTVVYVEASAGDPPTAQNPTSVITVSGISDTGWGLIEVTDPTGGEMNIVKVVRSDGKIINEHNYWSNPDMLHMVDNIEQGMDYTVHYDGSIFDTEPPVTIISLGEPKYATEPIYISSNTYITLSSTDAVSNIELTEYKIGAGQWVQYNSPFKITVEGLSMVYYRSKDVLENIEQEKSLEIFVDIMGPSSSISFEGAYLERK